MQLIAWTLTAIITAIVLAVVCIVYVTFFTLASPLLLTRGGRRLLLGRHW